MFYNYWIIAWRTLQKNKVYTFINILGLMAGIAAVLLLFRIVRYELSFNKNFEHYDRIVRIVAKDYNHEGKENLTVCTPLPAMDEMESISQFESMSRVKEAWLTLTIPNPNGGAPLKKFGMETGHTSLFVEPNFFKIFNVEWLAGNPQTALTEPATIVLTKSWAMKCFADLESAIGETVLIDNVIPVKVAGIIEDLSDHCDFTFPFLISYLTLKANPDYLQHHAEWGSCSTNDQVYALLKDPNQLEAANALLAQIGKEQYKSPTNVQSRIHYLQPISDLHYNEDLQNSGSHRTSRTRLILLSLVGVLILLMACFNFVNLATAQAFLRAKEVGVRKTLGSGRGKLIGQFISETGLIVFLAVILGGIMAFLATPFLRLISDVPSSEPFFSEPITWIFLGSLAILVTFLAGLYPALILSGFQPIRALKGNANPLAFSGSFLRKVLVVLQFIIAQGLIVSTIIILLQQNYIQSQELGFDHELVYTFRLNNDSTSLARQDALKQRLLQIPAIQSVSWSSDQPISRNYWISNFRYSSRPEDEPYGITNKFCDADYQKTYNIQLLAGRWLMPSDTIREAVVNMTLLEKLGITNPEAVIGQNIQLGNSIPLPIVGVTNDFYTHSFREEHLPLLMSTRKEFYWTGGVKISPNNISATILSIKQAFDEVLPEQVLVGGFLDEDIAQFYADDERLSATCRGFGILAILISCLGLFGLATHAAAQRTKEIGIRKVLGASVANIVGLLSKEFLLLVGIALLIASPIAAYLMSRWLEGFVFRVQVSSWIFLGAGGLALFIALLTVSVQAVRAAVANPVKSLKTE